MGDFPQFPVAMLKWCQCQAMPLLTNPGGDPWPFGAPSMDAGSRGHAAIGWKHSKFKSGWSLGG